MKDNKTDSHGNNYLPTHYLHKQSSLPNLLNLQNQPIEAIQSSHHIHKAYSPMRIIDP